jgi:hypothetical protein
MIRQANLKAFQEPAPKASTVKFHPDKSTEDKRHCLFLGHSRIEHHITSLWQGNTNGCGTTSLAMALNCLTAMNSGKDSLVTQEQLDRKRPFDTYCAPGTLVQLAQEHGFYARQYNASDFLELKNHLNQGHIIIALHNAINSKGKPGPLHYVVINGYQDDPDPKQQKLFIVDPGRKGSSQAKLELAYSDFCKYWDRPKLGFFPIGVNRFMVAVSAQDDLGDKAKSRLPVTIQLANLFHRLTNWYATSWLKPLGTALYGIFTLPIKLIQSLKPSTS